MKEEWRGIKGYEGRYQISSFGRVKSLKDRYGNYREKILKPSKNSQGYLYVILHKNSKVKSFRVHRLVALHFIENPNNYKEVNHKDENKENNKVDNLEWCAHYYNMNYGTRNKRLSEKLKGRELTEEHKKNLSISCKGSKNPRARKVKCITTGKEFDTVKEAGEYYSINKSNITACCRGKRNYCGKHPVTGEKLKWKYIDE